MNGKEYFLSEDYEKEMKATIGQYHKYRFVRELGG